MFLKEWAQANSRSDRTFLRFIGSSHAKISARKQNFCDFTANSRQRHRKYFLRTVRRMKKWFKDAITFSCTSCGKCCKTKGSNRVYLNLAESEVMSSHLGLSLEAFHEKYTDNRLDKNGLMLKSIKQHETKKQCTFLDGNKCSIYEARPTQCKTYPFWPQNMIGPAEWVAESHMCEGIKVTKKLNEISLRLPTSASATNFVKRGDDSVIALNMLAHQIHDRGRGENWTYEQSIELLRLTKKESPELLDDYLDTFYDGNESRIGKFKTIKYFSPTNIELTPFLS